jgi:uncharacterized DUF497 family protein
VEIEFDPAKDAANIAKHGISLARAADLDILEVIADKRVDYGETRFRAYGLIGAKFYCLPLTYRDGHVRAISLRRARRKEVFRHVPSRS